MERKKICALSPSYPVTKDDTRVLFVHQYFKELAKHHDITVISSSAPDCGKNDEIRDGVRIVRFNYFFPRSLQRLSHTKTGGITESFRSSLLAKIQMPFFLLFFFLTALRHAGKCDIIDAQWALSSIIAAPLGRLLRKPTTCKLRDGNIKNTPKFLLKWFLGRMDIIDGMNPQNYAHIKILSLKPKLIEIRGIMPFDRLDIKKDEKRFRSEFHIKDEKIITSVGRLVELKDPITFVKSIPIVVKSYPKVRFLLVGDGDLKDQVESLVKELGVEKHIIIAGTRDDVPYILNNTDIFVATSYINHCFSNTILESMFLKVPVVLTDAPMTKEVFTDHRFSIIVRKKDPQDLARGIIKLLKDDLLRKKIANNGPFFLKENGFMKEDVVASVSEEYDALMSIRTGHNRCQGA